MSQETATPQGVGAAPEADRAAAESAARRYPVKVRGEAREVSLEDALRAYLRTEDYKARTMALARERQALALQRRGLGLQEPEPVQSPATARPGAGSGTGEPAAYLAALGYDEAETAWLLAGPARAIVEQALAYRNRPGAGGPDAADKAPAPPAAKQEPPREAEKLARLRAAAKRGGERERAAYIIAKLGLE